MAAAPSGEDGLKELSSAVRECLEEKGVLEDVKAKIRKEIVQSLKDPADGGREKQHLSADNYLINELIRDYLDWNHYEHASEILVAESGQPKIRLERRELERQLKVDSGPKSKQVPLLYSLISAFKNKGGQQQ